MRPRTLEPANASTFAPEVASEEAAQHPTFVPVVMVTVNRATYASQSVLEVAPTESVQDQTSAPAEWGGL